MTMICLYNKRICFDLRGQQLYGGHMPCFDNLIRHVGLIQDFIDRVLQVQATGQIMSEKGVGS